MLRLFPRVVLASVALLMLASVACAVGDAGNSLDQSQNGSEPTSHQTNVEESLITNSDSHYTVNNFINVGFKGVTQFELETLPEAIDAWYGFHDQKDIELRFYESHSAALEFGIDPSEVAVGKAAVGYSRRPPRRWDAYAVAGNVVMLCELEITTCENLINEISR